MHNFVKQLAHDLARKSKARHVRVSSNAAKEFLVHNQNQALRCSDLERKLYDKSARVEALEKEIADLKRPPEIHEGWTEVEAGEEIAVGAAE